MVLVVNIEFAFHPGKTAVCVTTRLAELIMWSKVLLVIEHQHGMAHSPEFGTQLMFSHLRVALEGYGTEEESGFS